MSRRRRPRPHPDLNRYRIVWLFVLFDLPTGTPEARKEYARFRKLLLDEGFTMAQFSVYVRSHPSEERARVIEQRIRTNLPPDGEVRILQITDLQFSRMQIFHGKKPRPVEEAPQQLEFF
ncbi:MAG: CRISPR-associated endonuclease Cas2 [Candidatus Sumerlaeia bacterium]|nr:CRISPR-associated endonuclease Cas2 [Candidatus Sumerlaeia bacterium]